MAEGYGQHGGWDLHPAYVPYPASLDTPAPVEYGMSYQSTPTDLRIWSGYETPQYGCATGSQITAAPPPGSQVSTPLGQDAFKIPVRQRTNGGLDTHPKSPAAGKSPAADYTEKRRQQNRNSQIAFRQRSKMTMKLMQEELSQSLLTNEALYCTMEELLEKTENLKRSIEDVLASRLRRSHREFFGSPQSSSCLMINCDGTSG